MQQKPERQTTNRCALFDFVLQMALSKQAADLMLPLMLNCGKPEEHEKKEAMAATLLEVLKTSQSEEDLIERLQAIPMPTQEAPKSAEQN